MKKKKSQRFSKTNDNNFKKNSIFKEEKYIFEDDQEQKVSFFKRKFQILNFKFSISSFKFQRKKHLYQRATKIGQGFLSEKGNSNKSNQEQRK